MRRRASVSLSPRARRRSTCCSGLHQTTTRPSSFFVDAGFDEQRRFDEDGVADAAAPPDLELAKDDFGDARVHDGVEAVQLGTIREDHGTEFRPIDAAGRIGDRRPKFLEDFGVGRLAGFDQLVGKGICIKHCKPHFAEHGGNGAFAAGDAAGEAESKHIS